MLWTERFSMDAVRQSLSGVSRSVVLVTAAVCGAATLLLWSFRSRRAANKKIQMARERRNESLRRAEQAVRQYRESHPMMGSPDILTLSLPELTKQLRDGFLNPENVLYSYMEKTLEIQKKVNCCTGVLLESFEDVKTIDTNRKGLLYGVPISIKENYHYKNTDSSCGMVKFLDKPAKEDCVLVKVLKRQGAIPFVKTNVPQSMLSVDSSNPIYGRTVHPHNDRKTSGGSSSGEGALIAAGGSVLGFGTDIGGSVRIPASFCGISAFKPTVGRLSDKGFGSPSPGQNIVQSTAGPMARDVDSLALCMQALLCDHMFSLDPTVPPLPFDVEAYHSSKPLRIGYYVNDGCTEPSPSMARGVREVKALLEKAGHTMVPVVSVKPFYATMELFAKSVLADGGVTILSNLKGGPLDPCIKMAIWPYYCPSFIRNILFILFKPFFPRMVSSLSSLDGVGSVSNLWKHQCIVKDYINETIAQWKQSNIDVLLCPVIGPAFKPLYSSVLLRSLSYTVIYNVLNFPAGVVPVSTVTAEDEEQLKHYKGNYQDRIDKLFKQAVTGGEGLPVAVQCVALPWQDELCLRFMKEVEQLVKQSTK